MRIIGYYIDETGIYTSEGEHCSEPSYLDFLLADKPDTIRVFSNLNACVANLALLIKLSEAETKQLLTSKRKMTHLRDCGITLQYFPNKHFLIGLGWLPNFLSMSYFSDASQYSPELKQLHASALSNLDKAKLAKEVGEEAYAVFVKLGYRPKSLTSPVSVFRRQTFRELDLPLICDIPIEAGWLAYQCCKGGWVEAFTLGHFDLVYDYDINASYPSEAAKLHDLRQGKWLHSNQYQEQADYGYCDCEATISTDFSPIIWQTERGHRDRNYTPKGSFSTCLTKRKIDFIRKWDIGEVNILDGWWWFPTLALKPTCPLEELVNYFYQLRQNSSGLEAEVIKTILVGGFYGLFLETFNDYPTKHFLPPYAAEIQANVKLKVAEACYENNIMPLAVTVDGFVSEQPMSTPKPNAIGEWKLSNTGKALIISSGLVAIEGKTNSGEFSVDYNWLVNQIRQNPNATSYSMEKLSTLSLPLAYQRNRLSEVGKAETEMRRVNIIEGKRYYSEYPQNGGDLLLNRYESRPWSADLLSKLLASSSVEQNHSTETSQ